VGDEVTPTATGVVVAAGGRESDPRGQTAGQAGHPSECPAHGGCRGESGRDSARPSHPWPPPFTTIAWRLGHLREMLTLRADHTISSRALTQDDYRRPGDAVGALAGPVAPIDIETLLSYVIGVGAGEKYSGAGDIFHLFDTSERNGCGKGALGLPYLHVQ